MLTVRMLLTEKESIGISVDVRDSGSEAGDG